MKYILLILALLLAGSARAQTSCTPNNNGDFSVNGNVLSSTPLAAGLYKAGVIVNMNGTSNTGACFPVAVTSGVGLVQSQFTDQAPNSGQICTLTLNTPITAGDTVIGYLHSSGVVSGHPSNTIEETTTAITDSAGNTYSTTPNVQWNSFPEDVRLFYKVGIVGNPNSISFDFTSYAPDQPICNIGIVEYSGAQSLTITNPVQISTTITPSISITPTSPAAIYVFGTTQIAGQKFATLTTSNFNGVIDNFDFDGIGIWNSAAVQPAVPLTLNFTENPSTPNIYAAVAVQSTNVVNTTGCSDPDQSNNIIAGLGLTCNTVVSDDFDGTAVDTTKWGFWDCANSCATAPTPGGPSSNITVQSGYLRETELPDHAVHFLQSVNAENLGRPLFIEYRVRYMSADGSCIFCNGNAGYRLQEWSYGGSNWWQNALTTFHAVNIPEVDFNETFANNLRAGVNLWNWNGTANVGSGPLIQPSTAQTLGDNVNWHVVQALVSPNGGTYGTTTWWVDGVQQGSVQNPGPSVLNPTLSNLGTGYYYILSGYCNPNQGTCAQNSYHDIDYFHVYEGSGGGNVPAINSSLTASGTVGTAFSYQITASNNPTSFSATGLPGGLSVNSTSGAITGTPTAAGTSSVTIGATNTSGTGTATLTLTVNSAAPPTITVNGSSSSTIVAAGASISVAVTNGPGNLRDWVGICNPGEASSGACNGAGYNWAYIQNCSTTPPPPTATPVSAATCSLIVPSPTSTSDYVVNFFTNDTYTVLATASFTVNGTGGGGGGAGCSDVDTGLGTSFGLHCQSAMSDDCNGSGDLDQSKWYSYGQLVANIQSGGACHLTINGANGTETSAAQWVSIARTPPTTGEWAIDMRFRFTTVNPWIFGVVNDNWLLACNSASQPITCSGSLNFVNIPEVDINETYNIHTVAGTQIHNGLGGINQGGACNNNSTFDGTINFTDGNWHYWVVHVSQSAGTITWYMDGSVQNVASGCDPTVFDPAGTNFAQGYEEIFSIYCNVNVSGGSPNCNTAPSYTSNEDIDYIHMYY